MKQVIQSTRTGKLNLTEVPEPTVKAGNILVSTRASLISAGTERMVVEFARKSLAGKARERPDLVKIVLTKAKRDGVAATIRSVLARLDEPLPLGYSAAGDVVAVGAGLEGRFRVGQRVAVAGAGLANHAELNVIPEALAAPIPDDVSYEEACFGTLSSIAMHAVRNLGASFGESVAVIGAGLLGQLVIRLLCLSGVRVLALDYNVPRLDLARRMGAEATYDLGGDDVETTVRDLTAGRGMDGIIISAATESSEPFKVAGVIARDRARVCMVGLTGTEFPYREFMQKELNLVVSRSYGPGRYDPDFEGRGVKYPEGWVRWTETENLCECLRLMSPSLERRLNVDALTSHTFKLEEAEKAYDLVTSGAIPHLGVVLTYRTDAPQQQTTFPAPKLTNTENKCVLGVIGAGGFARSVLLPELKKMPAVTLHTVATQRGASAEKTGDTFGFLNATADSEAVLENPDINAILIATRHDSHADLTARALQAGKSVLVEKPLALSREGINAVIEARNNSAGFFQIGFNRRFAPMAEMVRGRLERHQGTKYLLLRINAGHIPPESWVHAADEGGGRILGEVCHFVDLARYFIGSPIVSVQADAGQVTGGACDDLNVGLRFADGSLATIAYTGLGDSVYSKELIEAYAGGSVVTIDNFQSYTIAEHGKLNKPCARAQDKGFKSSLASFVSAVTSGGPAPIDEAELIETSLATVAIMESLRDGHRIDLS
ncbi:MAG: Gfo/Idh/MocA family oxidoreductase [Rhodospirillaceae bacterium]|jgi:predicted dehydrogenase/threonine dehydrogenase-like Zn-dependent dehydrogenase|nr:Gfo/Idh/MocA family oxidoreductase [Rhodospirillaceae bacterium]MBT5243101.1 Gfo/Idh/MocA family oxidoreductase [Rhodospirillaceae bacterium]MBT5563326.1 Gfo/Idh/MocA family oxidoreductase [Rhodospirillaceae bacterium]MBT6243640.1 Gfo/Idh/MocA family oxidoreductase [Rhodospirillaceae bacterium]MBT7136428.1 Gfo/Idh/MocA family oxidoreductase [Rhodospirillaceae bacterium]